MGYRREFLSEPQDAFDRRRRRCEERYQIHIVGEASYQDAIRSICGGRTSSYADRVITKDARCVAESDNPADPNAIRVEIAGVIVGHLNQSDGLRYRERFGSLATTCRAMILGGWITKEGDRTLWSVRLDLAIEEKRPEAPATKGCALLVAVGVLGGFVIIAGAFKGL